MPCSSSNLPHPVIRKDLHMVGAEIVKERVAGDTVCKISVFSSIDDVVCSPCDTFPIWHGDLEWSWRTFCDCQQCVSRDRALKS